MNLDVELDEVLAHPIEAVWQALTEADAISDWLMVTSDFVPEVGARFRMRKPVGSEREWVTAEILELDPPRRMVWSWSVEEGVAPTVVTFELTPEGGSTRLRLTHVGEVDPVTGGQLTAGWPGRLEALGRSLERDS